MSEIPSRSSRGTTVVFHRTFPILNHAMTAHI